MQRAAICAIAAAALLSCSAADLARVFRNTDLEEKGIHLRMNRIPEGMYRRPFTIPFDRLLFSMSRGEIAVRAYNFYTVGNFEKSGAGSLSSVSNFLDPTSKFKDAWFGVYVILDDDMTLGRRFMLLDSRAAPGDPENLSERALLSLPALDQKIIVWSTHQGRAGYTFRDFEREFYFTPHGGDGPKRTIVRDAAGRSWLRIDGAFDTIAAVTDTGKSRMGLFSSIRNYVGLPDDSVYAIVSPWHPVTLRGCVIARYFPCGAAAFWAVVYFNGSSFTTRGGDRMDTWKETDIRSLFESAFCSLDIGCAEP